MKPTHCHHCHCPLVASDLAYRVWCASCSTAPEGKCKYCRMDVLEPTYCWPLQQQLDRALTRTTIGTVDDCPQCHCAMGVAYLTDTKAIFICPRCGRQLTVAWTWSRKAARGKPDAIQGPDDGPLPTY